MRWIRRGRTADVGRFHWPGSLSGSSAVVGSSSCQSQRPEAVDLVTALRPQERREDGTGSDVCTETLLSPGTTGRITQPCESSGLENRLGPGRSTTSRL